MTSLAWVALGGGVIALVIGGVAAFQTWRAGDAQLQITETPAAAAMRAKRCATIKESVADAGFAGKVTVACDARKAELISDTYPDHDLMNGIVGAIEQVPVPAHNHAAPVALEPRLTARPKTRDSSLGVAVNGVPIFDYTAGGEMSGEDLKHHQEEHDTLLRKELDTCGGHAGRGDDYHYHKLPTCMIDAMKNKGDAAIIGWAFDGFPIYGTNNPDGSAIPAGKLDVCNGQPDPVYGYRYHASDGPPYIIQCLMGEIPGERRLPRVPPLRAAGGGGARQGGRPMPGGVQGLTFKKNARGGRVMEYTRDGEAYYIRYRPSGKPHCYQFETRTIVGNGVVQTGEYCR
ncbi:MAG: YHYH protein [Pseudomonadota bacterium]